MGVRNIVPAIVRSLPICKVPAEFGGHFFFPARWHRSHAAHNPQQEDGNIDEDAQGEPGVPEKAKQNERQGGGNNQQGREGEKRTRSAMWHLGGWAGPPTPSAPARAR